jgi:hypothetical protein
VVVAARPLRLPEDEPRGPARAWLVPAGAALAGGGLLFALAILPMGTGLGDVFEATVSDAAKGRESFVIPLTLQGNATLWAIAALTAAVVLSGATPTRAGMASLKLGTGLLLWGIIGRLSLLGLDVDSSRIVLPTVLAWVAALPPTGEVEPVHLRVLRVFLPAAGVAEVLQVYPVAGSQKHAALVMLVPAATLCVADGLRLLRPLPDTVPAIALGLAALALWGVIVRPMIADAQRYSATPPAALLGAHRTHIDPAQAGTFAKLAQIVRARCTQFVGYPSLNSLYLWTEIRPPRQTLPGGWMTLIEDDRQAKVVAELEAAEKPCVVRNDNAARLWILGQPDPQPLDGPLVRYLDTFETAETVADWQVQVPKEGR